MACPRSQCSAWAPFLPPKLSLPAIVEMLQLTLHFLVSLPQAPYLLRKNWLTKILINFRSTITKCILFCFTNSYGSFYKDKGILFIFKSWCPNIVNCQLLLKKICICRLLLPFFFCLLSHHFFLVISLLTNTLLEERRGELKYNPFHTFKEVMKSWDENTIELINFCDFVWFFFLLNFFFPMAFITHSQFLAVDMSGGSAMII